MENWFFTHFLSDLPGPLPFYTALENNTIFYNNFSGFERGFPPPLRAPLQWTLSLWLNKYGKKIESDERDYEKNIITEMKIFRLKSAQKREDKLGKASTYFVGKIWGKF